MTPEERKQQSIEILNNKNIPLVQWLPVIAQASDIVIRSKEEVAKRFVTCYFILQVTCDLLGNQTSAKVSRRAFWKELEYFGLVDMLTVKEQEIFGGALGSFLGVGICKKFGFPIKREGYSEHNAIHKIMRKCNSLEEFVRQVDLRSIDEILDESDLIYRYHWACVDRMDEKLPKTKLNSDVVLERHRALNWLIGKNTDNDDWDHVVTDT